MDHGFRSWHPSESSTSLGSFIANRSEPSKGDPMVWDLLMELTFALVSAFVEEAVSTRRVAAAGGAMDEVLGKTFG
jgi:hypothetical protein